MIIEKPKTQFDKIKICIDFIPNRNCKVNMFYQITERVAYTELLSRDGSLWFSPWIMMKDKFGGDIAINECNSFQGVTQSKIYNMNIYGSFFRDSRKNYPAYIGYFDNYFKASKAFKIIKPKIFEDLKFEHALDENIEKQINEFKIRK